MDTEMGLQYTAVYWQYAGKVSHWQYTANAHMQIMYKCKWTHIQIQLHRRIQVRIQIQCECKYKYKYNYGYKYQYKYK